MKKILVVSPHPDDETLGAGGTLLKKKSDGSEIFWLNFTNLKEKYGFTKEQTEKRAKEIIMVAKSYGFSDFKNLELEPAGLDKYSKAEIIDKVIDYIKSLKPDTILLPHRDDVHSDHKFVFDTVYACTKIFRYPYIKKILTMEIISETDFSFRNSFTPNYFVDISEYIEKKIEIMKIYESEISFHPFPRNEENIRALALYRGSLANVMYAEAFNIIKFVE